MGYSAYIKINDETVATEYKFQGDIILNYAKHMLYQIPTMLTGESIIKLMEDFRIYDDSIADFDLGLDSESELYAKIYKEKCYKDPKAADFIIAKLTAMATCKPDLAPLYSSLVQKYVTIVNAESLPFSISEKKDSFELSLQSEIICSIPKTTMVKYPWNQNPEPVPVDLCALYDNSSALSVELNIYNKALVEKAINGFRYIEKRNKSIEDLLKSSLTNFNSLEIYAGY